METQTYYVECRTCGTDCTYTGNTQLLSRFISRNDICRCGSKSDLKVTIGNLK